jgi:hypothetical protein
LENSARNSAHICVKFLQFKPCTKLNLGRVRVLVERERGRKIQACENPHQIVKRIWFKKLQFLQVEDAMHRC